MTGMDGNGCLLRMICEASHTPSHADGLIGDGINMLLLPRQVLDTIPEYGESEYIKAQRIGQKTGDCSRFHHKCPTSFFQVFFRNLVHMQHSITHLSCRSLMSHLSYAKILIHQMLRTLVTKWCQKCRGFITGDTRVPFEDMRL